MAKKGELPKHEVGGYVFRVSPDGKELQITLIGRTACLDEEAFNELVSYARRHLGWTAYAPTETKETGGADDE